MKAQRDNITGRIYLENGRPVAVLARWNGTPAAPWEGIPLVWLPRSDGKPHTRTGPHNVLIERADGSRVVRPFRGLQTPPPEDPHRTAIEAERRAGLAREAAGVPPALPLTNGEGCTPSTAKSRGRPVTRPEQRARSTFRKIDELRRTALRLAHREEPLTPVELEALLQRERVPPELRPAFRTIVGRHQRYLNKRDDLSPEEARELATLTSDPMHKKPRETWPDGDKKKFRRQIELQKAARAHGGPAARRQIRPWQAGRSRLGQDRHARLSAGALAGARSVGGCPVRSIAPDVQVVAQEAAEERRPAWANAARATAGAAGKAPPRAFSPNYLACLAARKHGAHTDPSCPLHPLNSRGMIVRDRQKIEADAPPAQEWLRIDDVLRQYPFSRSMLYRLCGEGRLPIRKLGDRCILHRADVERLLETLPRMHPTEAPAA
jgi:hypothetical protein